MESTDRHLTLSAKWKNEEDSLPVLKSVVIDIRGKPGDTIFALAVMVKETLNNIDVPSGVFVGALYAVEKEPPERIS